MVAKDASDGIEKYFNSIADLGRNVLKDQVGVMRSVAKRFAETIEQDGRVFVFGTGHSHILAEEAFFRAGGLVAVVPIFMSNLMVHEKIMLSSRLERVQGVAGPLLEQYQPEEGEVLVIFSNSGVNAVPVEMALHANNLGLVTVGICSVEYSETAPLSPLGQRLMEITDYTINNHGRPGDALIQVPDTPYYVGPSSTVIGAMIWNALITETIFRLHTAVDPLPLAVSFNVKGSSEHNREVVEKWSKKNPHL